MTNNMSEKKQDIIRLVIYCVLSALPFVAVPFLRSYYGEPICTGEASASAGVSLFLSLGMMAPALANIITRLVTKEGFKDCRLGLNFKGNARFYIAAIAVKLLESVLCTVIIVALFCDVPMSELFSEEFFSMGLPVLLNSLGGSAVFIVIFFGEEFGWRGYMMPKLLKLMPKPTALIVGGVIWGLWHAPITAQGHNFGVEYPFFPWLGILLMTVNCTLTGIFLTYVSERTKSVFPAALCHAANNQCGAGMIMAALLSEKALMSINATGAEFEHPIIIESLIMLIPVAVTGIVSFILFCKKGKRSEISE